MCVCVFVLFSGFLAQEAKARGGEAWKAGDVDGAIACFSKVGLANSSNRCLCQGGVLTERGGEFLRVHLTRLSAVPN